MTLIDCGDSPEPEGHRRRPRQARSWRPGQTATARPVPGRLRWPRGRMHLGAAVAAIALVLLVAQAVWRAPPLKLHGALPAMAGDGMVSLADLVTAGYERACIVPPGEALHGTELGARHALPGGEHYGWRIVLGEGGDGRVYYSRLASALRHGLGPTALLPGELQARLRAQEPPLQCRPRGTLVLNPQR